jgi:biopolymer transport protein ExbB
MEEQTEVTAAQAPGDTATSGGAELLETQVGTDPSLADPALAEPAATGLEGTLDQGWEILQAGGPVVAILLFLSVVALAIVLVKLWQFRAARLGDRRTPRRALALYRAGRSADAVALASGSRNPVARVLVSAINGRARRDLPEAMVREEVVRCGGDLLEGLRGWFRPLEVIGSLAPLLGLFGTVLATAVGLAVAMPVIVLLNWLERRVDRLAHEMDDVVTQVFTEDLSVSPLRDARGDGRAADSREERSHGAVDSRAPALVAGR